MAKQNKSAAASQPKPQDGEQISDKEIKTATEAPAGPDAPTPEPEPVPKSETASSTEKTAPAASETKAKKRATATKSTGKTAAKGSGTVQGTAAQAIARQIFRSHPDRPVIYIASDGTAFFAKCDADNYGRTLKDPTIISITNANHKA